MALKTKKKRCRNLLLSFLLPFILCTISFILEKVVPFGEYTLLRSDAWAQYHPFLSLFRHTLLTGGKLEHTWSIGMGQNFMPTIAYYLASPLYLLTVFVPEAYLIQFMLWTTILKISLGGLFFAHFLHKAYDTEDGAVPFFALLYSVCGWVAGYYWNIMWLDVFALLPLLITGTLSMLREGRFRLYTLSLALSLWCNYYIAYCCCIFVLLSFVGYQICKWSGFKNFLRGFLRFGLCTVWAVCIVSVILLPTLMGMQNTSSAAVADFDLFNLVIPDDYFGFSLPVLLDSLSQLLARNLTNTIPTDLRGLPNLFTGFSVLILAFTFLFNKKFSRKDRLFHGGLLIFLVLSLLFKVTTFVWHGFHFPNMLPGRFTFLYSFVLVTMAFRGYTGLRELGIFRSLCALACGAAVLGLGLLHRKDLSLGYVDLALNVAVLLGTAFVILSRGNLRIPKVKPATVTRLSSLLMIVILLGEGCLSAHLGITAGGAEDKVIDHALNGQALYERVSAADPELFYRADFSHGGTSNDGSIHHYNGVDVFSSTALSNHGQFASALGIRAWPESNSNTYVESSPFTNTLCGIKYLLTMEDDHRSPQLDPIVDTQDGMEIHKQSTYVGMGFMTDSALGQFTSLLDNKDPFAEQAEIFRLATGLEGDLYHMLYDPELIASDECSLEPRENKSQFLYTVPDHLDHGEFTLRYTMEESGLLCIATRMLGGQNVNIYHNGEKVLNTGVFIRGILSMGYVEEGDIFELVYTSDTYKQAGINLFIAIQDDELLQKGLDLLSDEVWNITYADNTTLKGTVTALSDGLFYSSIPYEPGWTVTVDGAEVPIAETYNPKNPDVKLTDAQLCFPLSAGDHEIIMTYRSPGLRLGLCLSLAGLALFLPVLLCKKKYLLPDLIPTVKENSYE